jgi:hypothetical protein
MMNKMQRGGYGPTQMAKASAKEVKKAQAKRARTAGPGVPMGMGIQNPAAAKRAKAAVKAGAKARRKNSRSIQRRIVKVK